MTPMARITGVHSLTLTRHHRALLSTATAVTTHDSHLFQVICVGEVSQSDSLLPACG